MAAAKKKRTAKEPVVVEKSAPRPLLWSTDMTAYMRCALVAAAVHYIKKDGLVRIKTRAGNEFTYAAVTHDAVTNAVREAVLDYGLIPRIVVLSHEYLPGEHMTMLEVMLQLSCVERPDDFIQHTVWGYGQDYGDKGPGKALSYAVKNAYLKAFMLETGEDDEERIRAPGSGPVKKDDLQELQDLMDETDTNEADVLKYLLDSQGVDISKLDALPNKFRPMILALLKKKKKKLQ